MPITKLNLPQPGTPEYDDIIRRFEAKEELEGHIGELATRLGEAAQRPHESDHDHRLRMERLKSEITQETVVTPENQAAVEAHLRELKVEIEPEPFNDTVAYDPDTPEITQVDDAQKIDLDTATTADKQANVEAILHNLREDTQSVKYIHEVWHGGLHLRISVEPHGPDEISFRFFGDDDSVPDRITVFNLESARQFARGLILAIVASTDREVGFTMEDFAPGSWDEAPAWLDDEKRERVQRFIHALEEAPSSFKPTDADTDLDDDRQFLINYVRQQEDAAQRLMEIAERLSSV